MKDYKITEIRFEKILGIDYFEQSIIIRINRSLYKGTGRFIVDNNESKNWRLFIGKH